MNRSLRFLYLAITVAFISDFAQAQTQTGTPPFGSFGGGPFDTVNLRNLNVHFATPVVHKAGRGTPFTYDLGYDTSVWYPLGTPGSQSWQPVQNWGLIAQTQVFTGEATSPVTGASCYQTINGHLVKTGQYTNYSDWVYVDPWGTRHDFGVGSLAGYGTCNGNSIVPINVNVTAPDGSGYNLVTSQINGQWVDQAKITTKTGGVFFPPVNSQTGSGTFTDRNGNEITVDANGNFTDTLGTQAVTVSGAAPSPVRFSYTPPAGGTVAVVVSYKSYTIKTNFGCSGIAEYGPTSNSLVDRITLPDGSFYQFNYEPTPGFSGDVTGRLASVTLPVGGTISYAYAGTNNGIICTDGSSAGLTRTTPDGQWTYSRTVGSSNTTTITDPQNNQTLIQFVGLVETERQTYQGSSSSGTLLRTVITCYNGNLTNCPTTGGSFPITRQTQFIQLPTSTGKQCEHDTFYNSYGLTTEVDDYDYGTGSGVGPLIRKTLTTYASLTNGIVSMPATITIQDGNGVTKAQTNYTYDQGTPTAPPGTSPQHTSVTGSRGNPTTIQTLVQGTTFLAQTATYYDTGNPQTVTNANGAQTTYNYPDATSTCGNTFPASVTEPLNLSRSMTWNCTGGVQLASTDENGKTTTTTYSDAYFWRPALVTDPTNAIASFSYPTSSPFNWTETSITVISGSSVVDGLTTLDGLGRPHLQQTKQGPIAANYDTVETDYDSLGRVSRVTVPYSGTSGQTNSSGPATATTYDALSRPLVVTDAGNGTVSYTYTQNDTYISAGPAPSGENAKRRQLEYNGLGQLSSVCEVTSSTPSGSCGQTTSATGYLTKYVYDALGNLTNVTQNAQPNGTAQSRSYSFDGLSRLTSETNPESGTTSYSYDSATGCTGSYSGDLVQRIDAVGNASCLTYDALHRVLTVTYPSGSYASVTPSKYFVYDSATVNSVAMANAKSRLAEAYTCFAPCSVKTTDLGYSYSARGEVSDVYELTPHSSPSYYHVSRTYWPHGVPSQLGNNIVGLPAISYGGTIGSTVGLDGEGRITQVTASSGQNPVTGVSYNNSSLPSQVSLGSGDNDIFAYDPNTMRMTQYQFNINGQADTGALTWNSNSSLQKLVVTDAFNSADNQTCNYSHDDLSRIASANCGSVASQTFSYDPFGNISKSGSPYTFQPTYSPSTNHFATLPGFSPSYDANGNVLADGSHTYAWDADGNSISLDGVGLTFDALDRMVEQNRSGTYTEIVYSPGGAKLALMSGAGGQTLQKAFIPLPGRATAVYTGNGLDHYRHSDWLGSARLTSSPTRTVLSTTAYAPFGETYAQSGTADPSFTGQNQDTVSGDYDFLYREYSIQGRWPSPDPAGLGSVAPSFPQSWNRYAYVLNNPLSHVDRDGLICVWDDGTQDDPVVDGGADQSECSAQGGNWVGDPNSGDFFQGIPKGQQVCAGIVGSVSCANTNYDQPRQTTSANGEVSWWGEFFGAMDPELWTMNTGEGSCIQVALDAAQEPLHYVHQVVHPLEESLAPLTQMTQSGASPSVASIAAQLWSMTTGKALATGQGPVADDFRDILRQTSILLASTSVVVVPKLRAAAVAVEEYLPEVALATVDAIGAYAVGKEAIAAWQGKCKP
jgi:RHS repeat-associated protein